MSPIKNPVGSHGDDALVKDIDLISALATLWRKRIWLSIGVATATAIGIGYALLVTPIYRAQATIAMKEGDKAGSTASVLSQLGGFGGAVATQLGIGNTSLAKIEVILKGRDLADLVIRQNELLPILFPDQWDVKSGRWKDTTDKPTLNDGVEALTRGVLDVIVDEKRKLIHVGINARDPQAAKMLVECYLVELNRKLVGDVRNEASLNRAYLEDQLAKTVDPVLREKISTLIASELERFMLVSSRPFEVLETAFVPTQRAKPKRKLIVALSMVIGIVSSITWVLASPFLSALRKKIAEE
jgi:uncharacterized protein involved in exopolysaccharide biosynthesis